MNSSDRDLNQGSGSLFANQEEAENANCKRMHHKNEYSDQGSSKIDLNKNSLPDEKIEVTADYGHAKMELQFKDTDIIKPELYENVLAAMNFLKYKETVPESEIKALSQVLDELNPIIAHKNGILPPYSSFQKPDPSKHGAFGKVDVVFHPCNKKTLFARKRVRIVPKFYHSCEKEIIAAIMIINSNNPKLLQYFGIYIEEISGEYFLTLIQELGLINLADAAQMIPQIEIPMKQMELNKIYHFVKFQLKEQIDAIHDIKLHHLDIKSNNIVLFNCQKKFQIKLVDFGISCTSYQLDQKRFFIDEESIEVTLNCFANEISKNYCCLTTTTAPTRPFDYDKLNFKLFDEVRRKNNLFKNQKEELLDLEILGKALQTFLKNFSSSFPEYYSTFNTYFFSKYLKIHRDEQIFFSICFNTTKLFRNMDAIIQVMKEKDKQKKDTKEILKSLLECCSIIRKLELKFSEYIMLHLILKIQIKFEFSAEEIYQTGIETFGVLKRLLEIKTYPLKKFVTWINVCAENFVSITRCECKEKVLKIKLVFSFIYLLLSFVKSVNKDNQRLNYTKIWTELKRKFKSKKKALPIGDDMIPISLDVNPLFDFHEINSFRSFTEYAEYFYSKIEAIKIEGFDREFYENLYQVKLARAKEEPQIMKNQLVTILESLAIRSSLNSFDIDVLRYSFKLFVDIEEYKYAEETLKILSNHLQLLSKGSVSYISSAEIEEMKGDLEATRQEYEAAVQFYTKAIEFYKQAFEDETPFLIHKKRIITKMMFSKVFDENLYDIKNMEFGDGPSITKQVAKGMIYYNKKIFDKAKKHLFHLYQSPLSQKVKYFKFILAYADALKQINDFGRAKEVYLKLLDLDYTKETLKSLKIWQGITMLNQFLKKEEKISLDELRKILHELESEEIKNLETKKLLVRIYINREEFEKAEKLLSSFYDSKNDQISCLLKGQLEEKKAKEINEISISEYENAIYLFNNSSKLQNETQMTYSKAQEIILRVGVYYYNKSEFRKAIAILEQGEQLKQVGYNYILVMIKYYSGLSYVKLTQEEKLHDAFEKFKGSLFIIWHLFKKKVNEIKPDFIIYNSVTIQNIIDDATQCFILSPREFRDLLYYLALLYFINGNFQKSVELCEEFLSPFQTTESKSEIKVTIILMYSYLKIGKADQAVKYHKKTLKCKNHREDSNFGVLHYMNGDYQQAYELFTTELKAMNKANLMDRKEVQFCATLSMIMQGKMKDGEELIKKQLEEISKYPREFLFALIKIKLLYYKMLLEIFKIELKDSSEKIITDFSRQIERKTFICPRKPGTVPKRYEKKLKSAREAVKMKIVEIKSDLQNNTLKEFQDYQLFHKNINIFYTKYYRIELD